MAFSAVSLALLWLSLVGFKQACAVQQNPSTFDFPLDKEWTSLSKTIEFMPASNDASPKLRQAQHRMLNYFKSSFVDGMETQYNEYAQSWRLLGFYTDCNAVFEREGEDGEEERRKLEDGGEGQEEGEGNQNENNQDNQDEQGEQEQQEEQNEEGQEQNEENQQEEEQDHDEEQEDEEHDEQEEEHENEEEEHDEEEEEHDDEEEEEHQNQQANYYNGESICKRYLIWGAYVDLDYEGAGLSEYKFYNTDSHKWDSSACVDSSRCVKMDCHLKGTNFKQLGYFRQNYPTEFFQLLAAHQGSCSWSQEQAKAISYAEDWLPQKCTETDVYEVVRSQKSYLYYDLMPIAGGGVGVGLYTDNKCSVHHVGTKSATAVLSKHLGYDVNVEDSLYKINRALAHMKVCTPCMTFDLSNGGGSNFACQDNAGYSGVNQCKMFAQNSEIRKASLEDVSMASQQGTITRTFGAADVGESWWQSWGAFFMSFLVFLWGTCCFCCIAVKRKRTNNKRTVPLIQY